MLIQDEEWYCLDNLDYVVRNYLKNKFKPAEGQSIEEFNRDLEDEILLEKAYRCRVMADKWENMALREMKKNVKTVYGGLTDKIKCSNMEENQKGLK